MITTKSFMGLNDETNEAIRKMNKNYTKAEKVLEYFGISPADMSNGMALKAAGLCHTNKLDHMGVSLTDMEEMFSHCIEQGYFRTAKKTNEKKHGHDGTAVEGNSVGGEEAPGASGVEDTPKRAGGRKAK